MIVYNPLLEKKLNFDLWLDQWDKGIFYDQQNVMWVQRGKNNETYFQSIYML